MDTSNLVEDWGSSRKSRVATSQVSFRLPNFILAQIDALCEIYPHKNRTDIVTDLLVLSLMDLESRLPLNPESLKGNEFQDPQGIRGLFRKRSNEIFKELEGRRYFEPIFNLSISLHPVP